MFTGIIEEMGTVRSVISGSQAGSLSIKAHKVLENTHVGDSIAVNGVCLTVTNLHSDGFTADVMPETLRRTNLGDLRSNDPVNLERAMAADGRFGGHIVSGHIDGTGRVEKLTREQNAVWLQIATGSDILALIVEKGSIAIDGVSLTVASVTASGFAVSIIPHTGSQTMLLQKRPGDTVNLENDIIGKYVQRLLSFGSLPADHTGTLASDHTGSLPSNKKNSSTHTNGTATSQSTGLTFDRLRELGF